MSRKTKISCDVTREADNMLKAYCEKHERSKGFLIEKMIRRYCAEVEVNLPVVKVPSEKPKRKVFVKPSELEVNVYMLERGVSVGTDSRIEAQSFHDFYESKGWVVGKVKMKDWKAAVRNWLKGSTKKVQGKTNGNLSACEDFING